MRIIASFVLFQLLLSCSGKGEPGAKVDSLVTDSLAWFNKKVNASPNNASLLFERAKFHIRSGNADLAQSDLERSFAVDSFNLEAHKLYADIMLAKLNLEKSKYHFEFIIRHDSLYAPAYTGMGQLYALLENNAAAIAYLNKSLQLDPYQSEPYFIKGMIYRSDHLQTRRQESWDLALSSFQTAIEQDPENYSAYIQLGVMYDQLGDSTAVEYYNSALSIYPESIEAWYNKGMFYQNRNRIPEALDCYRKLNEIDSTWADPFYNQGYIYLLMDENLDSAIFFFDKAVALDDQYYQAYNNLGLAYEKKGDIENAKKFYMKAVEINPDFKIAKDNLNRLD